MLIDILDKKDTNWREYPEGGRRLTPGGRKTPCGVPMWDGGDRFESGSGSEKAGRVPPINQTGPESVKVRTANFFSKLKNNESGPCNE